MVRQMKEGGPDGCHCGHQQAAIEKKIPHLAARLGDEQAAMARGSMRRSIAAAVIGMMIGTNWIIGYVS
jgi:hypothetical protein